MIKSQADLFKEILDDYEKLKRDDASRSEVTEEELLENDGRAVNTRKYVKSSFLWRYLAEREEEEAKRLADEKAKASYTSIADSATSHKSAFFRRAQSNRDASAEQEEHTSAYGGIVRPSAIVDKERDTKKMTAPAMGAALEGQRPSIMDPNSKAAPTASRPMAGFKGLGGDNSFDGPSDEETLA